MKRIALVLLAHLMTLPCFAQEDLLQRYNTMLDIVKNRNISELVNNYTYKELFDIIKAEELIEALDKVYNGEEMSLTITPHGPIKMSKTVEFQGIKYVLIEQDASVIMALNKEVFVKDSIAEAFRLDSLRQEMEMDSVYQQFLATYDPEKEWSEDDLSIYDFPYHELDDNYGIETVNTQMINTLYLMEMGMNMASTKKQIKAMNIQIDTLNFTINFNNYDGNGQIGIMNPKYNEWQFITNNTAQPIILNYLVPIEVRKKLKIKS